MNELESGAPEWQTPVLVPLVDTNDAAGKVSPTVNEDFIFTGPS